MQSNKVSKQKKAMQTKYNVLIANKTLKLVERITDQYVLTAKQAFKCKQNIDSNIKRYKACWIARSFEQYKGIDYFKTFAAVIKPQTNKILFTITAKKKLYSNQVNIITAFLNFRLREKVYIEQPLYFDNRNKNQVFLLF